MKIQKLTVHDVPQVQKLIKQYAQKEAMLARSLNEIYENLRDYFIIKEDEQVVACVALHVTWADLGEIKSLAVAESLHGKGYGRLLVETCCSEAIALGIPRVFALTYKDDFFKKLGFKVIDKEELPRKIWGECVNCVKFMECDEICVMKSL